MRYAIVSDIHANWQAWSAVRDDFLAQQVDTVVCLGDIVGYGPSPVRVLADVRKHCENIVLGNHDAAAVDRLDVSLFRDAARRALAWTVARLDEAALQPFRDTPLMLEDDYIAFVHAENAAPELFGYVESGEDAANCFRATKHRLIFIGHTHVPGIFVLDGQRKLRIDRRPATMIEPDSRYLVNVGSVGDPRDGSNQASYGLFDLATGMIEIRKVPFDIDAYLAEIRQFPELERPWFCEQHGTGAAAPSLDRGMTAEKVSRIPIRVTSSRAKVLVRRNAAGGMVSAPPAPPPGSASKSPGRLPPAPPAPTAPPKAESRPAAKHPAWLIWTLRLFIGILVVIAISYAVSGGGGKHPRKIRAVPPGADSPPPPPRPAVQPSLRPMEQESAPALPTAAVADGVIVPDELGILTLPASAAALAGSLQLDSSGSEPAIDGWTRMEDSPSWTIRVTRAGTYAVFLNYALDPETGGSEIAVVCGSGRLESSLKTTSDWKSFGRIAIGRIDLEAGDATLSIQPVRKGKGNVLRLRGVFLKPVR